MVSIISRATNFTMRTRRGRDEVYIATVPLRAPKGAAQMLMSTVYSVNLFELQHFMVIINPSSSSSAPQSEPLVCDFQPENPEDIFTAIAALSGRKVPGVILTRRMKKLPSRKCWFVGYSESDAADYSVQKFNENWETDLRIGFHDCRNYAYELVEYLTGEKFVLQKLRSSNSIS